MTPTRALILVVDRNRRNLELLETFLTRAGYEMRGVSDPAALDRVVAEGLEIGLALIDVSGFDAGIWRHCQTLAAQDVPLMVIASSANARVQRQSLVSGARGTLVKPLLPRDLLGIIAHALGEGA